MSLAFEPNEVIHLPEIQSWPASVHILGEREGWALEAAYAARRPLLVRGEPGCGKSQLARVAATKMKRAFISEVVHAGAECRDLQFTFDAVARLGEAQTLGNIKEIEAIRDQLDPKKYLAPGPLWWALNWGNAAEQAELCTAGSRVPWTPDGWQPEHGCVVLIDEIDKAETDLPNGLLETLGNGAFTVPYLNASIGTPEGHAPPLVIITTNEERELPAAFLRRCLVLHIGLPNEDAALQAWLAVRGEAHFSEQVDAAVRKEAALLLCRDREEAVAEGHPPPGLAEYLDLLRALADLGEDTAGQLEVLRHIRHFTYVKHKEQPLEPEKSDDAS